MLKHILDKLKIDKPTALQWHEWKEWHVRTRTENPLGYWLYETVPDFFRDVTRSVTRPLNDLRFGIRVRLLDRYHMIDTKLKPGYHECDTRMLHGMFSILVDFVEVEKAWVHVVFDKEAQKRYNHPWWSLGWTRFKSFRNPAAGLEHLKWEMTLDDPNLSETDRSPEQAHSARETWELYHWWKNVRPARPDPYDAGGWTEYCDARRAAGHDLLDTRPTSDEDERWCREALDRTHKIEEEQHREDEEMLIRLIKIRRSMWT